MYYYKKIEGSGKMIAVNVCESCGTEFLTALYATTKYCEGCSRRVKRKRGTERVRRYRERQRGDCEDRWFNLDGTEVLFPEIDTSMIPEQDLEDIPEIEMN